MGIYVEGGLTNRGGGHLRTSETVRSNVLVDDVQIGVWTNCCANAGQEWEKGESHKE